MKMPTTLQLLSALMAIPSVLASSSSSSSSDSSESGGGILPLPPPPPPQPSVLGLAIRGCPCTFSVAGEPGLLEDAVEAFEDECTDGNQGQCMFMSSATSLRLDCTPEETRIVFDSANAVCRVYEVEAGSPPELEDEFPNLNVAQRLACQTALTLSRIEFGCTTPAPTSMPTSNPTPGMLVVPTASPSTTAAPTASPVTTATPTAAPTTTATPTSSPSTTATPTASPSTTATPTASPTPGALVVPTAAPTAATGAPTAATGAPTAVTGAPTAATGAPTAATGAPTAATSGPTGTPTGTPTANPTAPLVFVSGTATISAPFRLIGQTDAQRLLFAQNALDMVITPNVGIMVASVMMATDGTNNTVIIYSLSDSSQANLDTAISEINFAVSNMTPQNQNTINYIFLTNQVMALPTTAPSPQPTPVTSAPSAVPTPGTVAPSLNPTAVPTANPTLVSLFVSGTAVINIPLSQLGPNPTLFAMNALDMAIMENVTITILNVFAQAGTNSTVIIYTLGNPSQTVLDMAIADVNLAVTNMTTFNQGTGQYIFTVNAIMAVPTTSPSAPPTAVTTAPSNTPTANPSANPTANPSINPTAVPSANPTVTPSANPSANPTANPSANPTATPSANPTANPSANPTANPSANPTANPSANPTANPSANPTANPSANPTNVPTGTPTSTPTANPVGATSSPTGTPTNTPTTSTTTNSPTSTPTGSPV